MGDLFHDDPTWNSNADYLAGITLQRERFKNARNKQDLETMYWSLQNILDDILHKVPHKDDRLAAIKKVQQILFWYIGLEKKYEIHTEDGSTVNFPRDILYQINHKFTIAYRLLMAELACQSLLEEAPTKKRLIGQITDSMSKKRRF